MDIIYADIIRAFMGAWLSWLERYLDKVEVGGSIPLVPIFILGVRISIVREAINGTEYD